MGRGFLSLVFELLLLEKAPVTWTLGYVLRRAAYDPGQVVVSLFGASCNDFSTWMWEATNVSFLKKFCLVSLHAMNSCHVISHFCVISGRDSPIPGDDSYTSPIG